MENTNKKFNTKQALYTSLKKELENFEINSEHKKMEYNLYIHQTFGFDEYGDYVKGVTCRSNAESILKSGLKYTKYSSVHRTLKYHNELKPEKALDIINYFCDKYEKEEVNVFALFPMTMPINGIDIDVSTPIFQYSMYNSKRENLNDSQYTHAIDAMNFSFVPVEFIGGYVITHTPIQTEEQFAQKGGVYELNINAKHYSKLSKEERAVFNEKFEARFKRTFRINDNDDKETIDKKVKDTIREKDKVDYESGRCISDSDY